MDREVMDFITNNRPALVATVSPEGIPNVAPKGSLTVLDEERLMYAELVEGRTSHNIARHPEVAVVVQDRSGHGFQIKGRGHRDENVAAYGSSCDVTSAIRMDLPPPQAVIVIHVTEVQMLEPPHQ
jgi:predicted pyridoxine 5'-phosphate oxidase superfamily flavin-nucleotide-binding protein